MIQESPPRNGMMNGRSRGTRRIAEPGPEGNAPDRAENRRHDQGPLPAAEPGRPGGHQEWGCRPAHPAGHPDETHRRAAFLHRNPVGHGPRQRRKDSRLARPKREAGDEQKAKRRRDRQTQHQPGRRRNDRHRQRQQREQVPHAEPIAQPAARHFEQGVAELKSGQQPTHIGLVEGKLI